MPDCCCKFSADFMNAMLCTNSQRTENKRQAEQKFNFFSLAAASTLLVTSSPLLGASGAARRSPVAD